VRVSLVAEFSRVSLPLIRGFFPLACGRHESSPERVGVVGRSVPDSAYQQELADWLRDSTVLDSMSRLVPTDSLYRLYRRALEPSGVPRELVQRVWCEELRLTLQYGMIPSERAVDRLLDTVYRDQGIRNGFEYFAARAPSQGIVESSQCNPNVLPRPQSVGRTRLDRVLPPKPRPPD
jgi:hypothetical protein